jgi:hypothetical protein
MATPLLLGPSNMDTICKISGTRRAKALLVYGALLLCAGLSQTFAVNLSLGWDPSPDTQVVGYKMYFGPTGSAKQNLNVGNATKAALTDLAAGQTYEFYVTAYDSAGAESDPSNQITYTIPADPIPGFVLSLTGFTGGSVQVSPRGSGPAGDRYAAGTLVTLSATPNSDVTFAGWSINGGQYFSSRVTIQINGNTTASPSFQIFSPSEGTFVAAAPGELSMSIQKTNGEAELNIGGEVGAWVLEASNDLKTWQEAAAGMTSERLPISITAGNAFFRVRAR